MQNGTHSIALISDDPAVNKLVESVVQFHSGASLNRCEGSLSQMNGAARKLSAENDLVIFRAGSDLEDDVAALQEIARGSNGAARVVAVADSGMPFSEIRRLTAAGALDVLPDTIQPGEFSDLIGKWLAAPAPGQEAAPGGGCNGMILPVCRARGGIGATTVAVNLADCLTQRKGLRSPTAAHRVALVDLDLQFGTVSSFLNLPPNKSLYELASEGFMPDATFLKQSMAEVAPGLWALTSPAEFAPIGMLQPAQIEKLIMHLRTEYDFVVLDLPRVLVEWLSPVFEASDRALLLTDCSVPSVYQSRRYLDFLSEIAVGLKVEVVACHERKPLLLSGHHKEAARLLQHDFRHWLPHDPAAAAGAADKGAALSAVAGRAPLAKGIKRLAQDLISARAAGTNHQATIH